VLLYPLTRYEGKLLKHSDQLTLEGYVRSRRGSHAWRDPACNHSQLDATLCDYSHGGQYVFWVIHGGIEAWTDPSPPPPAPPPPIAPAAADSTKHLPMSPEACIGITFGAVGALGVVMAVLLRRTEHKMTDLKMVRERPAQRMFYITFTEMTDEAARRGLFFEFVDLLLDWVGFVLAFYSADLKFDNDPDHVIRTFITVLCVLSTVSWFLETVLYWKNAKAFRAYGQHFNFALLLVEDGMQTVLYTIVASGNATSGTEDSAMQVIVMIAAGIQSLLFFLGKGLEMIKEQSSEFSEQYRLRTEKVMKMIISTVAWRRRSSRQRSSKVAQAQ
jgi:hypothetical protein